MNSLSVIAISVLLLAPAAEPTEMPRSPKPFTPTAAYQTWTIHGFTFRMSPEIREHPEAAIELVGELDTQLCQIIVALPPQALANLREVTTWVEYDSLPGRSACYHVSRDWLIPNGYNPEKAGAVEISTVRPYNCADFRI